MAVMRRMAPRGLGVRFRTDPDPPSHQVPTARLTDRFSERPGPLSHSEPSPGTLQAVELDDEEKVPG